MVFYGQCHKVTAARSSLWEVLVVKHNGAGDEKLSGPPVQPFCLPCLRPRVEAAQDAGAPSGYAGPPTGVLADAPGFDPGGLRIPVATIVTLVAKGQGTKEILALSPDLEVDEVREALPFAAEAVRKCALPLRLLTENSAAGPAHRGARRVGFGGNLILPATAERHACRARRERFRAASFQADR
jgi:hypothetical protein